MQKIITLLIIIALSLQNENYHNHFEIKDIYNQSQIKLHLNFNENL